MTDTERLSLTTVVDLGVKRKHPPGADVMLVPAPRTCAHLNAFEVDEALAEVTCCECGAKLNPMHVLKILCSQESRWHRTRAAYQEEMKRISERERTKCQHCGQMTRISRR